MSGTAYVFSAEERALVDEFKVEELAREAAMEPGAVRCDRRWLARFALIVAAAERRACMAAVQAEMVDADATGSESDAAYNQALRDASDAIARRAPQQAADAAVDNAQAPRPSRLRP